MGWIQGNRMGVIVDDVQVFSLGYWVDYREREKFMCFVRVGGWCWIYIEEVFGILWEQFIGQLDIEFRVQ